MEIPCHGGPLHGQSVRVPDPPWPVLRAMWPAASVLATLSNPKPHLLTDSRAPEAAYELRTGRAPDGWPMYGYFCPQMTDPRGADAPGYVKSREEEARERVLAEVAALHERWAAEEAAALADIRATMIAARDAILADSKYRL